MYQRLGLCAFIVAGIGWLLPLPAAEPPKPPVIPDAHRADFFKAQSELLQAQATMQAAQQSMAAAVENMNKDCGDKHQPQLAADKNPVCIAKIPVVNAPASDPKK